MVNPIVKDVGTWAAAENRLWQITDQKKFSEIEAKAVKNDGVVKPIISGEEMIAKIDSYFAKKGAVFQNYKNLDFLKDVDVNRFIETHKNDHPQMKGLIEKDLLAYVNQYNVIANAKKGLNPVLAEKTIAAVDELYPEGKCVANRFNPFAIVKKATDIDLSDSKGLSHQLHRDNKDLPRNKAYVLALDLLNANHILDAHKIIKGTALHVPESMLESVYSTLPKPAFISKCNQK